LGAGLVRVVVLEIGSSFSSKGKGAAALGATPCNRSSADQRVCWIAESSQAPPRRRTNVHT